MSPTTATQTQYVHLKVLRCLLDITAYIIYPMCILKLISTMRWRVLISSPGPKSIANRPRPPPLVLFHLSDLVIFWINLCLTKIPGKTRHVFLNAKNCLSIISIVSLWKCESGTHTIGCDLWECGDSQFWKSIAIIKRLPEPEGRITMNYPRPQILQLQNAGSVQRDPTLPCFTVPSIPWSCNPRQIWTSPVPVQQEAGQKPV